MKAFFAAAVLCVMCAAPAFAQTIPLPRPRPHLGPTTEPREPRTFAEANPGLFNTAEITDEPSPCRQRLEALAIADPLPRLIGPGTCGGTDMVRLWAVKLPDNSHVAIRPAAELRCETAEAIAKWVIGDLPARFKEAPLVAVQNYDSYECRGRNRIFGARISEHGKGNALDVRAFVLADGKLISPTDMYADHALREGLREGACARFSTVLGPGSDGFHEEHIHLDMADRRGHFRMCQWVVRDPPGLAEIPLPRPRPANLGEPTENDETAEGDRKI